MAEVAVLRELFLGILMAAGPLNRPSWVDLGLYDDLDPGAFAPGQASGRYQLIFTLDRGLLCSVTMCAIQIGDNTRRQENLMYATRGKLNCP